MSTCTHLVYDYYFDKESSGEFPEQLVFEVLTAVPSTKNQDNMYGYYWNKIAESFLKRLPNRSIELLSHIFNSVGPISRFGDSGYIAKIADEIVFAYPLESWKIISGYLVSETANRYEIIHWLGDTGFEDKLKIGAINCIPPEKIINWAKEDAEERLWIIEEVLPKTLEQNAGGQLTRFFIEEFCDDDKLARSLFVHFHMGGWAGPESNYLSIKRDLARQWISEIPSTKVQLSLGKYIDYLSNRIEAVQIDEERMF